MRRGSLLLVAGLMAVAAAANGPSSFVAGDLIVKFTDASEPGRAVARAMRAERLPDEITAIATGLSADLGVALVAARVTSGRELVLSIDRERLVQALRQRLKRDPAVRDVVPLGPPKTARPAAQLLLVVDLAADSEAQRQVEQAFRAGRRTTPDVDSLVARLTADAYPKPAGHVSARAELILTVDVAALTRELIERLKRHPDVEYAQLSHIVRPYGGEAR